MTLRHLIVAAAVAGLLATGCATVKPRTKAERFGSVDPMADRALSEQADALEQTPNDVRIVKGEMPEGLVLSEGGSKLTVAAGFEKRFEVLGSVKADYVEPAQSLAMQNLVWTPPYEEGWRKAYCYPQIPLKIVTLSLWASLVPLNYPCWGTISSDGAERQHQMIERLKRGAKVMGANLVVLTHTQSMQVISGNQYGVHSAVYEDMGLGGFAVREVQP